MSVSYISSVDNTYQTYQTNWQNNSSQIQQGFQDLASALQAGNLSDAQSAFTALQQLLPDPSASNKTQTGQSGGGQNQFATDLSAVGNALTQGDLSDAQQAFATLQQDMQSVQGQHHHHHHHHGSGSTQSTDSATSNSSSQSTNGSGQSQFATDFSALGQALQNGNLSDAQQAFATLQQDMQPVTYNSSSQLTNGSDQSQFATDISALGQALQSGDLSQAQTAFATLQQDMQSAFQSFNALV